MSEQKGSAAFFIHDAANAEAFCKMLDRADWEVLVTMKRWDKKGVFGTTSHDMFYVTYAKMTT